MKDFFKRKFILVYLYLNSFFIGNILRNFIHISSGKISWDHKNCDHMWLLKHSTETIWQKNRRKRKTPKSRHIFEALNDDL